MSKNSQANDGRESLAFLFDVGAVQSGTTAIPAGTFVIIVTKASTGSAFGAVSIKKPFYCVKETTPASGDTYAILTPKFMGYATAKDYTRSKNTTDVTMDYDKETNNVTDGQITKSGSINGMMITESLKDSDNTAINIIKSRFGDVTQFDSSGSAKVLEANTTEKDLMVIFWNLRSAQTDELVEAEVIPALFTECAISASYNSSQTFNLSFSGNASDENGYEGGTLLIPMSATLKSALSTDRP